MTHNPSATTPGNTQRFTGRAEDYDRYRQRYPTHAILDLLRTWIALEPTSLVADIGAGTGMLAEVFLDNGNPVLAIETNPEMRAACTQLRQRWPHLQVLDATAEATTLPDASIDIVAAGRAFHWFDKHRALAEFHRILKPRGWLIVVSLGRTHDESPAATAFEQLLATHGTDYNDIRANYRVNENLRTFFPPETEFHQIQLPGTQPLDWPTFRGQTMSLSVVPDSTHPNYEAFQQGLRAYFDTHATNAILTMPTTCWVTAARIGV